MSLATSAIWIAKGVLTIAVGLTIGLTELRKPNELTRAGDAA